VSELHNRLEQLVNYSSQLIFVGSDSVANQQRNLSDFLALQQESTEVSFLTASDEQDASDYRRIICRQLANHTVGSFVRPLTELLQDIDPNKGHYLVCISQAQYLDMTFLSELWEWVATSRQHHENLHINVILFGEQSWTERAQEALPDHNSNKPVLLSTQSVDAVGFDVNALENLMAQKRAFFAPSTGDSILKKTWFISAVLGVFLVIFIALMTLQYPHHVATLLSTGKLPEDIQASTDEAPTLPSESQAILDLEEIESIEDGSAYTANAEVVTPSVTDELLVSNWEPAERVEPVSVATNENLTLVDAAPQPAQSPVNRENESEVTAQANEDFAVDDIVSVSQLDEQLSQTLTDIQAEPLELSAPTTNNFLFDESTLLTLPASNIVLQLAGMQNLSVLQSYISDNNLQDSTWVYQTQRYGGPWYVVLSNQSFSTIAEATASISSLSENVVRGSPFAKTVQQIQQEINLNREL
jgi:DamX protein